MPALLTTTVGSFPKPPYLQKARNAHARGELPIDELEKLEVKATKDVIALQEELGIDVLVDGPYVERLRATGGLRGSSNQEIHLLTGRYRPADLDQVPPVELQIDLGGNIRISGFPEGLEKGTKTG